MTATRPASSRQRRRKALGLDAPRTLLPRVDDVIRADVPDAGAAVTASIHGVAGAIRRPLIQAIVSSAPVRVFSAVERQAHRRGSWSRT
jgi:hypothetical protein